MLVLRALDLNPRVLAQRNPQRQRHRADEPVGVHEALARPLRNKKAAKEHKPAVHPAEEEHLVAAHARHETGELGVVVARGHNAVDLGHEDVRHHRGEGDEDATHLNRYREHRDSDGARERTKDHVRHALVDQLANLVTENPRTEGSNGTEERPVEPGDIEPHAELEDREPRVEREQRERHEQLRRRHTHGTHAKIEQDKSHARRGQRREHLPRLLELELLMGEDVRVEDRGEERRRHIHSHDGHELAGETHLIRSEASREERPHVRREG